MNTQGNHVLQSKPWMRGDWQHTHAAINQYDSIIIHPNLLLDDAIRMYYIGRYDALSSRYNRGSDLIKEVFDYDHPESKNLEQKNEKINLHNILECAKSFYHRGYIDAIIKQQTGIDPIHPALLQLKPQGYADPPLLSEHHRISQIRNNPQI